LRSASRSEYRPWPGENKPSTTLRFGRDAANPQDINGPGRTPSFAGASPPSETGRRSTRRGVGLPKAVPVPAKPREMEQTSNQAFAITGGVAYFRLVDQLILAHARHRPAWPLRTMERTLHAGRANPLRPLVSSGGRAGGITGFLSRVCRHRRPAGAEPPLLR
jgi:hypothetical protein